VVVSLGNELAHVVFSHLPMPVNLGKIGVISGPENLLGKK
jgi:hypothetical protein